MNQTWRPLSKELANLSKLSACMFTASAFKIEFTVKVYGSVIHFSGNVFIAFVTTLLNISNYVLRIPHAAYFLAVCFLRSGASNAGPAHYRAPSSANHLTQRRGCAEEELSSTRGGLIKDNTNGPAQFAGSCFLFFGWLVIFSLKKPTVVFRN